MKMKKNIFQKLLTMKSRKSIKFDVSDSLSVKKEAFLNEFQNILPGNKVVITIYLN